MKMEEGKEAPKILHRGWKAMPYIIGNETFEKLGTVGLTSNLVVYLTTVFNMKHVSAILLLNVWSGTTNFSPLLGAFLSDACYGRYKTHGFACIASFTGMFAMTLTAAVPTLHPHHCAQLGSEMCTGPTTSQLAFLLFGFSLLVVGAGGIRPCNLAFGADQFNPETESGRRGINSFFNWYYFTFTFAMMISLTVVVYIQDKVSWALGLGIPTLMMLFSCAFFFIGSSIYVKIAPEGSAFTGIAQVIVAAFRKRNLTLPDELKPMLFDPPGTNVLNVKLQLTNQFSFLTKAAIQTSSDSAVDRWRLCNVQQVEEVKCLLRVVPIWASGIIYNVAVVQQTTYAILQAMKMNRHLGRFEIPPGSFNVFSMLMLTLWLPVYDRVVMPWARRATGKEEGITLLQRMGTGMVIAILAMVVAGLVESKRRVLAITDQQAMSAFWLVPQFCLTGLSEALGVIGQIELYYKQFPENMRSVAGSLFFLGMAGANYLSALMVAVVHSASGGGHGANWLPDDLDHGRLDYFYYTIGVMVLVNLVYFLACARWYVYKGEGNHEVATDFTELKETSV
ncbi:hypothetical protein AMTRI_Chr03g53900 [Amborella trichopoda]